jgi:hypothetical protein
LQDPHITKGQSQMTTWDAGMGEAVPEGPDTVGRDCPASLAAPNEQMKQLLCSSCKPCSTSVRIPRRSLAE